MDEKSMCVALTGATGFVGARVLQRLLDTGHRVRALVRDRSRIPPRHKGLTLVEGDLFQPSSLTELVRDDQAVIHLVGIIMEKPSQGQTFQRVHVQGTKNLLAAAKKADIERWVHMSAIGARPEARANYHLTKWQGEQAVRTSGLAYTTFRPSIIHGPRGAFMKMVKDFWCKAFPPFVPYFGSGSIGRGGGGRLQPVWVEDVAQCFVDAITHERTIGETYPMGGPDEMTWPQLYLTCKPYFPKARDKPIVAVPVWYANMIARLPGVPFNRDQVIMSQEDATCRVEKLMADFNLQPAPFERTLAEYASRIP